MGIIYFKDDIVGKQALNWWTKTVATKDTKYNAYAVCGDQKYLELFPSLFDFNRIKILDIDVGHGAPWNVTRGKFTFHDGKTYFVWNAEIVFNTKDMILEQLLVFFHYSHFTPDYINDNYKVDRNGEWGNFLNHENTKYIYDMYFNTCKPIKKEYCI